MDDTSLDTSNIDPQTLAGLMQALPQIQQQQRRVQQMRAAQQQMQDTQQNMPPPQNYQPRQQGGLYPTVQRRMPDYGNAGSGIANALGAAIAQHQGNNAEDQLNQTRNAAILRSVQGASAQPTADNPTAGIDPNLLNQKPTQATLRAYLALMQGGNADVKDIVGQIPHVVTTKVGSNGHLITVLSDNSIHDTGVEADYKDKLQAAADGTVMAVPMSGAQRGIARPVQMAGGQGGDSTGAPQQNMPTGFDAINSQVAQREGGYVSDGTPKGTANYGINQAANPDIDVKNLTPDRASQILKTRYWDALGADNLPPALQGPAYDAAVHMGVGKAQELLQQSGGDPTKFGQLRRDAYDQMFANGAINQNEYLSGIKRNRETLQGGPAPTTTTATGPNGNVTGTAVTGPQGNTGGVLRVKTAGENAGDEAQAKANVAIATAPALGAAKASDEAQGDLAKKKSDLKLALPGQNENAAKLHDQIQRLKNDPALEKILAGTVAGAMKDEDFDSRVGELYQNLNPDAARAIGLYQQVRSNAALAGLAQFRGLGMRITQGEFNVDAKGQTMLKRKLSKDDFIAELDRLDKYVTDNTKNANDNANSPTWRPDVRATTEASSAPAAAPAGQMSDADLRKKYGL